MLSAWRLIGILLATVGLEACVSVSPTALVSPRAAEPSLAEIRTAAARTFFGAANYDETSRITLSEQLPQETREAACIGSGTILQNARQIFQLEQFEEVGTRLQYPDFSLHVVRNTSRPGLDIVLFYFKIDKAMGITCRYTLGAFARAEDAEQNTLHDRERDRLERTVKMLVTKIADGLATSTTAR